MIHGAYEQAAHGTLLAAWVAWLLLVSMVLTAGLTVAYSLRAWLLVFLGPAAGEVHAPSRTLTVPLVVLAVPTALGGLAVVLPGLLGPDQPDLVHWSTAVATTLLVLVVGAGVLARYRRVGRDLWRPRALPVPSVDRVWELSVVRPVRTLSRAVRDGDRDVVDGWAEGTGWTVRGLGGLLRRAQTGSVQTYLLVVVAGAALLAVVAGGLT